MLSRSTELHSNLTCMILKMRKRNRLTFAMIPSRLSIIEIQSRSNSSTTWGSWRQGHRRIWMLKIWIWMRTGRRSLLLCRSNLNLLTLKHPTNGLQSLSIPNITRSLTKLPIRRKIHRKRETKRIGVLKSAALTMPCGTTRRACEIATAVERAQC